MSTNKLHYYLIFLINPFIGLFAVLKDFRKKNIAFFFPVFLAFVGASIYPYGDAERYRDRFYDMYDKEISFENFKSSLLDGETSFDVAVPLISYTVSTFTRNEKILFAVFGLILGIFYGKNIQFLLDKLDKKNADGFVLLLIIIFSMLVPFWDGIRGVRMWTAAHIYFYCVSRAVMNNQIKYWPFLVLACLYHFSFLFPTLLFLLYYFLPKRLFLFPAFLFFVLSLFVSESNFDFVKSTVVNNTPIFFEKITAGYTNEEYVEKLSDASSNYSFHHKYGGDVIKYTFVYLLVIAYYFSRKKHSFKSLYNRCFLFVFLLFGMANILSLLPSGGRFINLALMFFIVPIYFGYVLTQRKYLYYLSILPLLLWLLVTIRESFYTFSIGTIIGNPLVIFFDFTTEQNLENLIN